MALKKVEKTGVYRHQDGSAVYLTEGAMVDERVLDAHTLDADASKDWGQEPERAFFSGVQDAPQNQKAEDTWSERMVKGGAPENKAMPSGSDAELAADAAKGKKS